MLNVNQIGKGHVNGIQALVIHELAHIGLSLLRKEARGSAVCPYLDYAALYLSLEHGAVFLHDARLHQHQGVDDGLVAFIV